MIALRSTTRAGAPPMPASAAATLATLTLATFLE